MQNFVHLSEFLRNAAFFMFLKKKSSIAFRSCPQTVYYVDIQRPLSFESMLSFLGLPLIPELHIPAGPIYLLSPDRLCSLESTFMWAAPLALRTLLSLSPF